MQKAALNLPAATFSLRRSYEVAASLLYRGMPTQHANLFAGVPMSLEKLWYIGGMIKKGTCSLIARKAGLL